MPRPCRLVRQAVCFISVSQLHAGAFLHATCTPPDPRMPSAFMRIFLQRRPGLPLSVLATTKAGVCFGDLAVNREQLFTRQVFTLPAWFAAVRTVHGASAVREPLPALHSAYILDAS